MIQGFNIVQLIAWSGFVNGIFALGIGLFVLASDWKRRSNQFLFFFSFAVAVWALSYSRWLGIDSTYSLVNTAAAELFWTRLAELGSVWIPITYANWLIYLLNLDSKKYWHIKYVLAVGYALTILCTLLSFTPLFVSGVRPEMFFRYWPTSGILYNIYIFVLYCGLGFVYMPLLLYKKIREDMRDNPSEVKGMFVLSVGLILATAAGATNFPLFFGIPIPPYENIFVCFWVFFIGYVTIRYNTLHLKKVVATELLVAAIWLFLLSRMFLTILGGSIIAAVPDMIVLLGSIFIGFFLIRSVLNEVRQKEQLSTLNLELDKSNSTLEDLSKHLQEKVDEQTKDVRKAYEVEHKARIELEQLAKNKDQFILATQHHLRTPLTIIKGYMQSLLQKPPQDFNPKTKEVLQNLDTNADKLSSLVNELLDVSEMQIRKSIPGGEATTK